MATSKPGIVEQDQALTGGTEDLGFMQSLYAMEDMDRTSPELWPEKFPGVANFINSFTPPSATKMPYSKEFSQEDQDYLHQLAQLGTTGLVAKVKELHDTAYRLGQQESREIARGKLLNLFRTRRNK